MQNQTKSNLLKTKCPLFSHELFFLISFFQALIWNSLHICTSDDCTNACLEIQQIIFFTTNLFNFKTQYDVKVSTLLCASTFV